MASSQMPSTMKNMMNKINVADHWIFISVGILVAYYLFSTLRLAWKKGLRDIPGPVAARFTGLSRVYQAYEGRGPSHWRNLHHKYGPIVRAAPYHVWFSDPKVIPTIYGPGASFKKSEFYAISDVILNEEKFPSQFSARDQAQHRNLRSQVSHLYSPANLTKYEVYVDDCITIFIAAMKDQAGQTVDLSEWMQWFSFDVIGSITFQRRFGFMEQEKDIGGMIEALHTVFEYFASFGQYPEVHKYLLGNKNLINFIKLVNPGYVNPLKDFLTITENEINRYDKESVETKKDRVDFLAQIREKGEKGSNVTYNDLVNHLSGNLTCFYYLVQNPDMYKKLQAEIDTAEKEGKLSQLITNEQCAKLPYLQAVIKEAVRKHPGICGHLERVVPEGGTTLCGHYIPAGTVVGIAAPVINHVEEVWGPDADVFRPERWIEASEGQLKSMEKSLGTFGLGSRACMGKNISFMEMGKLIPQILRDFHVGWASPDHTEWKVWARWLWRQQEMFMKLTPRTQ